MVRCWSFVFIFSFLSLVLFCCLCFCVFLLRVFSSFCLLCTYFEFMHLCSRIVFCLLFFTFSWFPAFKVDLGRCLALVRSNFDVCFFFLLVRFCSVLLLRWCYVCFWSVIFFVAGLRLFVFVMWWFVTRFVFIKIMVLRILFCKTSN